MIAQNICFPEETTQSCVVCNVPVDVALAVPLVSCPLVQREQGETPNLAIFHFGTCQTINVTNDGGSWKTEEADFGSLFHDETSPGQSKSQFQLQFLHKTDVQLS